MSPPGHERQPQHRELPFQSHSRREYSTLAGGAHAKFDKSFVRDRWPDHHSPILDGSPPFATGVAAAVSVATTVGGAAVARGSATMARDRASTCS